MSDLKAEFGARMLELRKSQGKSQAEAAKYLDLTVAAYQNYEAGRREAGYETICKLADFYGVTTDYLLGRKMPAESLNPMLRMTNEEMEQRLLEAYFRLPAKLRKSFINGMADELKAQGKFTAEMEREQTTVGEILDRVQAEEESANQDAG